MLANFHHIVCYITQTFNHFGKSFFEKNHFPFVKVFATKTMFQDFVYVFMQTQIQSFDFQHLDIA
ncbi:MAG: hypothetical protein EBT00_16975 [Proteobacteria bacterium]|nr:hypothetical protein [Pseudomonadota bacterium]